MTQLAKESRYENEDPLLHRMHDSRHNPRGGLDGMCLTHFPDWGSAAQRSPEMDPRGERSYAILKRMQAKYPR